MIDEGRAGAREPALNAPWPPLLLAVALVGLYAAQDAWGGLRYALVPAHVSAGMWSGLLTSLFVHGGWAHVLLNALGLLAFGAAVSRLLGTGPTAAAGFFLFYLVCGVMSGAAYVALHPLEGVPVVGASGAVAGLMGAASRLLERPGRLARFTSPTVLGMAGAWLLINMAAALFGTLPGAGGAGVAWEAHLAGYAVGLFCIGPLAGLAGRGAR